MSRNTLIALWALVGVFALGCVLFLVWHSRSSHQAKVVAANSRISQAVATANEWMAGRSSLDGEAVQKQLTDALGDEAATETRNGESVLSEVRQRRQELAENATIEQARREAQAIFESAKERLDAKQVAESIALLREYVAHPHATEKPDADRLLSEADVATSDPLALNALIRMTDEEFAEVQAGGEIRDGKVTHAVLLSIRNETVRRNLAEAVARRQEIRTAKDARREAERLAAVERQRQQDAQRQAQEEELRRANEPFDLKGDRLGMSLHDFKAKYARTVEGHPENAPFSSETRPRQEIVTLLSEAWHTDAGIVTCSIIFPLRRVGGKRQQLQKWRQNCWFTTSSTEASTGSLRGFRTTVTST